MKILAGRIRARLKDRVRYSHPQSILIQAVSNLNRESTKFLSQNTQWIGKEHARILCRYMIIVDAIYFHDGLAGKIEED